MCRVFARAFLPLITVGVAFAGLWTPSPAQEGEGRKYAILVGVKKYDGSGLTDLQFAEKDVTDLAAVLEKHGYDVTLLTRAKASEQDTDFLRPSAKNIHDQLKAVMGRRKPEDTVLVAFSGHGAHLKKTDKLYFCPADTDLADEKTLVAVDDVMATFKGCNAGNKLLLFDACRNDPLDGRGGAPGELKSSTRPLIPEPPGGTVALFSCSKGEISHESKKFGRGFLFHHVIEGLEGKAAGKSGQVTWLGLAKYVEDELPDAVRREKGPRAVQVPELRGSARGAIVLVKSVAGTGTVEVPDLNLEGDLTPQELTEAKIRQMISRTMTARDRRELKDAGIELGDEADIAVLVGGLTYKASGDLKDVEFRWGYRWTDSGSPPDQAQENKVAKLLRRVLIQALNGSTEKSQRVGGEDFRRYFLAPIGKLQPKCVIGFSIQLLTPRLVSDMLERYVSVRRPAELNELRQYVEIKSLTAGLRFDPKQYAFEWEVASNAALSAADAKKVTDLLRKLMKDAYVDKPDKEFELGAAERKKLGEAIDAAKITFKKP